MLRPTTHHGGGTGDVPGSRPAPSPRPPAIAAGVRLLETDLVRWHWLGAAMFVLAGLGIELVPVIGDVTPEPAWALHVCAAVNLLCAAGFAASDAAGLPRLGRAAVWLGAGTVTALVATTYPVTWFGLFYLWPLLGAVYVQSRRGFATFLGAVLVAYAGALAVVTGRHGDPFPVLEFLMFALAAGTVMAGVRGLREGLDALLDQLEVLSSTDPLTGLANRRTFEREFADGSASGEPLTVLLFDLDHFKAINDVYGHSVGDEALQRFAGLLDGARRAGDTAARIGGEEFALIMRGADAVRAERFAAEFAATLRADSIADPARPPLTVSVGIAELSTRASTCNTLLVEADRALYAAKRAGRDRVVVAEA